VAASLPGAKSWPPSITTVITRALLLELLALDPPRSFIQERGPNARKMIAIGKSSTMIRPKPRDGAGEVSSQTGVQLQFGPV
jgi:hypothetical protein